MRLSQDTAALQMFRCSVTEVPGSFQGPVVVFWSTWVFRWSVFSSQTSLSGLAHNKLGEPGDHGTKRRSASVPRCHPRRTEATITEGLRSRLWTPLPAGSVSNPQTGLKMTLDSPGPKTWAPSGDASADTQRPPEAFQSLDSDTAQWWGQKPMHREPAALQRAAQGPAM